MIILQKWFEPIVFAEVSNCGVGICFPRSDEFLPVQVSDTFGDKFKVQKSRKHAHQAQMYNISDNWREEINPNRTNYQNTEEMGSKPLCKQYHKKF